MSYKKSKGILTLSLVVILIVFSQWIPQIPIYERGIVVGCAIDLSDSGKVALSAQLVVAGSSSGPDSKSAYAVITGEGESVISALTAIAKESAVVPSYAHCDTVLVSEDAIEDFKQTAYTLFSRGIFSGDCQVIAVKGKAKDALGESVPVQDISAFYINRVLSINEKNGGRTTVSLKDFVEDSISKKSTPYLPYAESKKDAVATQGGGSDSKDKYIFDIGKILVPMDDGNIIFDSEVTQGVGLVESKSGGVVFVKMEEDKFFTVQVIRTNQSNSYEKGDTINSYLLYSVRLIEHNFKTHATDIDYKKLSGLVEEEIRKKIGHSYTTALDKGVDIFNLASRLEKYYGSAPKLGDIKWNLSVTVRFK